MFLTFAILTSLISAPPAAPASDQKQQAPEAIRQAEAEIVELEKSLRDQRVKIRHVIWEREDAVHNAGHGLIPQYRKNAELLKAREEEAKDSAIVGDEAIAEHQKKMTELRTLVAEQKKEIGKLYRAVTEAEEDLRLEPVIDLCAAGHTC